MLHTKGSLKSLYGASAARRQIRLLSLNRIVKSSFKQPRQLPYGYFQAAPSCKQKAARRAQAELRSQPKFTNSHKAKTKIARQQRAAQSTQFSQIILCRCTACKQAVEARINFSGCPTFAPAFTRRIPFQAALSHKQKAAKKTKTAWCSATRFLLDRLV